MIALGWAVAAWAGQVFYEEVPLEQVVGSADAAVIVEIGDPAMRPAAVPVPGSAEKSCGTYEYGVWRVTVREVVRSSRLGPVLAAGDVINVFPGNTPDLVDLTHMACTEGMSVSPIFATFHGESVDAGDRLLVLLRWSPPYGWIEAVAGSWVDTAKARALAKDAPTGRIVIPDVAMPTPLTLLCVEDSDCASAVLSCDPCTCPGHPPDAVHRSAIALFGPLCAEWTATQPATRCAPCALPMVQTAPPVVCRDMTCRYDVR